MRLPMNPKPNFVDDLQSRHGNDRKGTWSSPSPVYSPLTPMSPSDTPATIDGFPSNAFPSILGTITAAVSAAETIVVTDMEALSLPYRNPRLHRVWVHQNRQGRKCP